jgi:hypothetical protein
MKKGSKEKKYIFKEIDVKVNCTAYTEIKINRSSEIVKAKFLEFEKAPQ